MVNHFKHDVIPPWNLMPSFGGKKNDIFLILLFFGFQQRVFLWLKNF